MAAHVPLQEAVHLRARLHVADDLAEGPPLSARKLEGEHLADERAGVCVWVVEGGAGDLLLLLVHLGQQELDEEELLKLKAPPRPGELLLTFWEVNGPQRHAALHQVVLAYDPVGHRLLQLQAVLLEEVVQDAAHGPAREADIAHRLPARVERHDAARVEQGALLA